MCAQPVIHRRQSRRLHGYDHARPGMYFVTLCCQDRRSMLGHVERGEMRLNAAGELVRAVWQQIPDVYPEVALDAFQVMPNHLHGIVVLGHRVTPRSAPPLGDVIRCFKMLTTRRYAERVHRDGWPPFRNRLWQRDYYDHIVRGDRTLDAIRRYIVENPARWDTDPENPTCTSRTRGGSGS
jgi:REP element-mobilizing transposase RayT